MVWDTHHKRGGIMSFRQRTRQTMNFYNQCPVPFLSQRRDVERLKALYERAGMPYGMSTDRMKHEDLVLDWAHAVYQRQRLA